MIETIAFYFLSAVAIVSALGMVLNVRNTVAGAMSLVVTMIALSGVFVLLQAHLIAALQIMIYAGAIVVLFLFVVMLLNLRTDEFAPSRQPIVKFLGAALAIYVGIQFLGQIELGLPAAVETADDFGNYRMLARTLFTDYVLPFEMASLLLLAAIVGAVILAKRRVS